MKTMNDAYAEIAYRVTFQFIQDWLFSRDASRLDESDEQQKRDDYETSRPAAPGEAVPPGLSERRLAELEQALIDAGCYFKQDVLDGVVSDRRSAVPDLPAFAGALWRAAWLAGGILYGHSS